MKIPKEVKQIALQIIDRNEFQKDQEKQRLDFVRDNILKQLQDYKKDRKRFEEVNSQVEEVQKWIESMGYSVNDLKNEIYHNENPEK